MAGEVSYNWIITNNFEIKEENETFVMCFFRVATPNIWLRFALLFFIERHKTVKMRAARAA